MRPLSDRANELVGIALAPLSLAERLRGRDRRPAALRELAGLGDVRVIPSLLPLIVSDEQTSDEAVSAIAALWHHVGPADLAWIDEQARKGYGSHGSSWFAWTDAARRAPGHWTGRYGGDAVALGLLACHPSGYLRYSAVNALATVRGGRELPFLALRSNDWVPVVAERASEILLDRIVPDACEAVAASFPFLARTLGQMRRDHRGLADAIRRVVRSDAGAALLARVPGFRTPVRRLAFDMLDVAGAATDSAVLRAALHDPDPGVRLRVVRQVAKAPEPARVRILQDVATTDGAAFVRARALALLAEHEPNLVRNLVPGALLDRGAAVRGVARYLATTLGLSVVSKELYARALHDDRVPGFVAAIEGLGEVGNAGDAELILPFADHRLPAVRRAVLHACGRLGAPRAIDLAIGALDDRARSVRKAAARLLIGQRARVDFAEVERRVRKIVDAQSRAEALTVLAHAPKWEAVAFLLDRLGDPDYGVQQKAAQSLEAWTAGYNRSGIQPDAAQIERLRALLRRHEHRLPQRVVLLLTF